MLYSIIALSILVITFHFIISFTFGKKNTDVDIVNLINEIIQKDGLDVTLDIKNESPYYNSIDKIIVIPEGLKAFNVAAGFHELGHVYDDADKKINKEYSVLQYYFMKYSIVIAIMLYYGVIIFPALWMFLSAIFFSLTSVYFFKINLDDELGATRHAKRLIKKHTNVDAKTHKAVHLCLYSGLSTYFALMGMSLIVIASNVFMIVQYYI